MSPRSRLQGLSKWPSTKVFRATNGFTEIEADHGAGTIIKDSNDEMVRGLTSAATIWATAAIGIAIGLGQIWIALIAVIVVWFILRILGIIEKRALRHERQNT